MDIKLFLEEFQDYLAPKLDTYEQVIYLYIFRHSRLQGKANCVIGFKSVRKTLALGSGVKGNPMSEGTCYEKLRSLRDKGCLELLDSERSGTRVKVNLPSEIPGIIPASIHMDPLDLEDMDFFGVPEYRLTILRREGNKCFYCLRQLTESNYVIEHILSRPDGTNSYKNVVAACRSCNNKKGEIEADSFMRGLYRKGLISVEEFEQQLRMLQKVQAGELKPDILQN